MLSVIAADGNEYIPQRYRQVLITQCRLVVHQAGQVKHIELSDVFHYIYLTAMIKPL